MPAASTTAAQLVALQRSIGNQAVGTLLARRSATGHIQREPPVSIAPAPNDALQAAIDSANWAQAATLLEAMDETQIEARLVAMSHASRVALFAGTLASSPRLTAVLGRVDLAAAYEGAVRKGDWANAAVFLNGFSDSDIDTRARALSPADRKAMREATPDWAFRVRRPLLDLDFQAAVAAHLWSDAVTYLNGFNDTDISARLTAMSPPDLLSIRAAAVASSVKRISDAVDHISLLAPQSTTNTTDTGNAYTSTVALFPNGLIISKEVNFQSAGTFATGKFDELRDRVIAAVTTFLSGKYKLKIASASGTPQPGDGQYPITVQVIANASASYPMTLHGGAHGRSGVTQSGGNIYELGQATETSVPDIVLGHESAHMILGASDEYANASVPGRVVTNDHSLMGNFYTQGIAQAAIKARHFQFLVALVSSKLPGRTVSIVP